MDPYLKSHQGILVAISGGQDSLCLLKLLTDCIDIKKNKIHTIYIDHQWKNDSKKHSQHIINMMKSIRAPAAIYQIKQLALSENEARKIRYRILIQHALRKKCSKIIMGHNSNDQIETVISNLVRGTGLDGITNFSIHKKIKDQLSIIRPLINFTKAEITWISRLFYLPVWSDETNYNLNLKRSRIRYELLPYLQNFFNPNIQQVFTNFIHLCYEDNEYIKENTIKLYMKTRHKIYAGLNLQELDKQHKTLQKRVLKLYFYYHFYKQINTKTAYWILSLNNKHKQQVFHFDGLNLQNWHGWLYINIAEF